jgi:NDP-sugar pyrophosphorylase family protein
MSYRKLTDNEIQDLKTQGCSADDWKLISVSETFITHNIQNVYFSGKINLGNFTKIVELDHGIQRPAGLRNAYIKDCTIKDNVYIADIKCLANYSIEKNVVIDNVSRLMVNGETSFANGIEVSVLNEGGGREVPIFDQLTSQIAYLITTYRHDQVLIKKLTKIIQDYCQSKKSKIGLIEENTSIKDCGIIQNVTIGSYAQISGVNELTEGTIISNEQAPTRIGRDVIARSFIILSGSTIDTAALLDKTFVGQGVQIGKQFSAENTLIFANSECFHSEVCSIYAGPYTVTHHKSTLLIAAMFSFYNAGSGSNQSNHMYKLGPIHQGILERGAKTGTFSYLLWPSRIGAFSVVIGKHYSNFDNSNFPFSYILESDGKTLIKPALNFFTVGTKRDSQKWPNRDRREDPDKLDIINFDLLSPYIMNRLLAAEKILQQFSKEYDEKDELIPYKGQFIEKHKVSEALKDYNTIINLFIGSKVIEKLTSLKNINSFSELKKALVTQIPDLAATWIDVSGMICSSSSMNSIIKKLKSNSLNSVQKLRDAFLDIDNDYKFDSWCWCLALIYLRYKVDQKNLTKKILKQIISSHLDALLQTNERIIKDAGKEFTAKSRIGYGIDGSKEITDEDFENVIGNYDKNSFVTSLREESEIGKNAAEDMISWLNNL